MIRWSGWLVALLLLAAGAAVFYGRGDLLSAPALSSPAAEGEATYQCSMHPEIVTHEPGLCPICQMKLQKVDGAPEESARRQPKFYRHPMRADVVSSVPAKDEMGMDYIPVYDDGSDVTTSTVPGHAPFALSAERQQMIGVTRQVVEPRALQVDVRAVGRVAYDPALYQAVVEYREALRSRRLVGESSLAEARRGGDAIVRGARLKLRQQGLSEKQIDQLAGGGDPLELLLPGDAVWVYAQVYEHELGLVEPGQMMSITTPAKPGHTFTARVAGVDPILDPATRTARVRMRVPTPEADLHPESFVDVKIHVPLGESLAVPEEAVLDTGEHRIVFVVKGEGSFEPRSVRLGRAAQGYYEVLSGLAAGDEVVTSANFLIDSESRFRAALAASRDAASRIGTPAAHAHAGSG